MNAFSNEEQVEAPVSALPYMRQYSRETVVIKYGGSAMTDEQLKAQVMEDIVFLRQQGVRVVLVHGGGPEITELMGKLGKVPEFVDGLRVTDRETMDIVQMVLAGKVNKTLVNLLQSKGGCAMGISGMDGRLLEAEQKDPRLGFVGKVTNIHIQPVLDLLEKGYIPVVSTIGCDRQGNAYNINGDTAAAGIAGALRAKRFILMTDVRGILRDPQDPDSLIADVSLEEAEELFRQGVISGGMIPKVQCCIDAIARGVGKVTILDGRVPHAILTELLTDEGVGTTVYGGGKNDA